MATYQTLFVPIFILVALSIFIGGIVVLQVLDRLFQGSKNLLMIRVFCISVILNIIILVFLLMSFARVKLQTGPQGPTGNKGEQGTEGKTGVLQICSKKNQTIEEKKTFIKNKNYLDLKPPLINNS